MAFVKLDTGILDSTLWITRDPREVFITALLMAMPRELEEDTPTYKVHSLEKSDFVVPAGWYGFIEASGPGIVRRAGLPPDAGLEALAALSQPDPESRSSDWEGRRLVRVDGGFVVLNFMRYRDKDNTVAARMARYRDRLKAKKVTSRVTPVDDVDNSYAVTLRKCRLAESEAESESEKSVNTLKLTLESSPASAGEPATVEVLENPKPKTEAYVPPSCPQTEVLALWAEVMPDMPQHLPNLWKGTRADHLRARWRESAVSYQWRTPADGLKYLRGLFEHCRSSKFLMGKTASRDRRPFELELAWLVNPTNWAKVIEGKFHA
jgi:hypothetical protein